MIECTLGDQPQQVGLLLQTVWVELQGSDQRSTNI
jgi:hypothetical protein